MKKLVLGLVMAPLVLFATSSALAAANCKKHPKEKWIPEAEMKKKIETEGYKIKIFKVAGDCYEIYGWDKTGKKTEVYFDTLDGSVVKSKTF